MKYKALRLCILAAFSLFSGTALAQNPGGDEPQGPPDTQKFGGMEFGVGLSLSLGKSGSVRSAEVVNGIVRVSKTENARARIILETHYLFTPTPKTSGGESSFIGIASNTETKSTWGFGPFVAFQPGTDQVIEAIGGGIMVGFKRPGDTGSSFNIGIGGIVDVNAQVLGDGITEGKELPEGETTIRYKQRDKWSFLVMTSFTF